MSAVHEPLLRYPKIPPNQLDKFNNTPHRSSHENRPEEPPMTAPFDIAATRELLAAATPGPWEAASGADGLLLVLVDGGGDQVADCDRGHFGDRQCQANAALIAAAPTLLASALDAIAARDAEVERLRNEVQANRDGRHLAERALDDDSARYLDVARREDEATIDRLTRDLAGVIEERDSAVMSLHHALSERDEAVQFRDEWRAGIVENLCKALTRSEIGLKHMTEDRADRHRAYLAARAEVEAMRLKLSTPQIDGFIEAVRVEAVHQRERWPSEHDASKADADWFWLIGYLAGKALRPEQPNEKRLHHIITTAAVCLNWHAHVTGADTSIRPGIEPPVDRARAAKEGA